MTSAFTVAFAPERAQYCVERADGMRVYPMPMIFSDPDAGKRAATLCAVLNRMEARECTSCGETHAQGTPCKCTGSQHFLKPDGGACQCGALPGADIPPDYCAACDLAVYAIAGPRSLNCPECGAQVAEGTGI